MHVLNFLPTCKSSLNLDQDSVSTMSRRGTYVDNAMNRSLGRVGMTYGSAVASSSSRSSGSGGGGYTSSSYSSSTPRTYVDNAMNRSIGRVGKPVGSHVVSRDDSVTVSGVSTSGSTSTPSLKVYVDNPLNQSLGRVGQPHGDCVQHKDGSAASQPSFQSTDKPPKTYKDNAYNRKHGRVGKPIGSHVIHYDGSVSTPSSTATKAPRKKRPNQTKVLLSENDLDEILSMLSTIMLEDADRQASLACAQFTLQRSEVEENWGKLGLSSCTDHSAVSAKEVIPLTEISLDKKIGEGGFGQVFAGLWKGTPIAYKKLKIQLITNKRKQQLVKEIQIFSKLDDPNIVKMFGVVVERDNIGIVMEYLPTTLFHALFIEEVEFSYTDKKRIITEVISAISYLHSQDIAHCDIKCQNVLLDSKRVAKICDFGLSAIKNASATTTSASAAPGQGTPRYSAPEVLRGELLKLLDMKMADIYSLTLVIYQVLHEEEPFEELSYQQLVAHVGHGDTRPKLSETLTEPVKDLLSRGWDKVSSKRPEIAELKQAWSKIDKLFL